MTTLDLNADIGEADTLDWAASERAILDYVTSVNIACGGHAGDRQTMTLTVRNAHAKGVAIGAHPAYPDRANFGRRSMVLEDDIDPEYLRDSLTTQIKTLIEIAAEENAQVRYVKPHGALYNDSVTSSPTATLIAEVIQAIDPELIFMGAPNSEMGRAAKTQGLRFISEGFIDRRYTKDGHLQSRSIEGAVIKNHAERIAQAVSLGQGNTVMTASGTHLRLSVQSLCVHGDSAGAVETARQARIALEAAGLTLKAFTL